MNRYVWLDDIDQLAPRGEFDEIVRRCTARLAELGGRDGAPYPEGALLVECIAQAHYDQGDYCAAAIEYEHALGMHRAHQSLPYKDIVRCLLYSGRNYLYTGRPAEAELALVEALTLLDHMPPSEQIGRGFVLVDLAQLHRWEGELDAAEALLLQAIKPMLALGYGNCHFASVYLHLAAVYEVQGRIAAADRAMEKAVRYFAMSAADDDDADYAWLLSRHGVLLGKRGRLADARAAQSQALAILQRVRQPGHHWLERVNLRLAALAKGNVF